MDILGPHAGLALATALAGYINAILLFYQLRKQDIYQIQTDTKQLWLRDLIKIIIAMVVMAGIVLFINPEDAWWQAAKLWSKVSTLLMLVAAAILSYFATLFLLGVRKQSFTI